MATAAGDYTLWNWEIVDDARARTSREEQYAPHNLYGKKHWYDTNKRYVGAIIERAEFWYDENNPSTDRATHEEDVFTATKVLFRDLDTLISNGTGNPSGDTKFAVLAVLRWYLERCDGEVSEEDFEMALGGAWRSRGLPFPTSTVFTFREPSPMPQAVLGAEE